MTYKSDKRLYLNADRSEIVEEGSPEATFLLVSEGGTVSTEDAKKYGLSAKARDAAEESEDKPKSEADKAEQKQLEEPPQNKARAMRSAKD